jgi:two-component system CheB/CheR fusion protein
MNDAKKSKEQLLKELAELRRQLTLLEKSDVTERKQSEEDIRRMATVVKDSNDAITIQDFEGRITAWNHGAEQMYGYSEEEALQKSIWLLTPPDKAAEQREFTRRLIAGEKITSFETQRVTKDGRVLDVWLIITKLMDDAGKPIGIASTERDITDRKRSEEALRESEQRYLSLYMSSRDAIMILEPPLWISHSGIRKR